MASTRLPGKVMLPLAGRPALQRMVERVRRSQHVDDIIVATTTSPSDDAIVSLCEAMDCRVFRGSIDDVLGRVLGAARETNAQVIVELTGDCPLIDHRHIDRVIELFNSGSYDLAANTVERSFPDGFDVQVFPLSLLEEVDQLTQDPIDRVHVSYYIHRNPGRFRLANLTAEGEMYWPDLGVTLDEKADYELIRQVFELLLPVDEDFSAEQVVGLLRERPELLSVNRHVMRKKPSDG